MNKQEFSYYILNEGRDQDISQSKSKLVGIYLLFVVAGLIIGYTIFSPIIGNMMFGLTMGFIIGGGPGSLIVLKLEKGN
ncbi:hypothetical protein J14TS2_28950 [Bacillus sp. J14TS2]|uniref:hypothetical protein n=1 Tax=Bacillus sp. J14TS2 TaxID=2807188 RepID=UPI001B0722A2|nr:hypothetical protein [Bacillus sp. J14TS2]GIN72420.1 hypothetical protein J14TS2_28950 [Bacillus sp. J14TS2]